jgi:hypothetical protein
MSWISIAIAKTMWATKVEGHSGKRRRKARKERERERERAD